MSISILFGMIISVLFGMIAVTSETCRQDHYTCLDGTCVEGRMRCDGIPQCEESSDEINCHEPPTVSLGPNHMTIAIGTTGTLRCNVTGEPEPIVTWHKSGEKLAANHQVNGNVLRISHASMTDNGIYVCQAENVAGKDLEFVVVEVEQ